MKMSIQWIYPLFCSYRLEEGAKKRSAECPQQVYNYPVGRRKHTTKWLCWFSRVIQSKRNTLFQCLCRDMILCQHLACTLGLNQQRESQIILLHWESHYLGGRKKAKRVTIQKITIGIDEEIIYNHEGDEPQRKVKTLAKQTQNVGVKMPEAGYFTNLGLVFPAKDLRDSDGIMPRAKQAFPMYSVSGFTTTGSLYKIEYFLTVKVKLLLLGYTCSIANVIQPGTYEFSQRYSTQTTYCRLSARSRCL